MLSSGETVNILSSKRIGTWTSGDISKYTGIHQRTVSRWIKDKFLVPISYDKKRGRYDEWHVQAVLIAMHYQQEGMDYWWCGAVMRLLGDLGKSLIDEVDAGRTWLAPGVFIKKGRKKSDLIYVSGRMVTPPSTINDEAELVTKLRIDTVAEFIRKRRDEVNAKAE